jgi:hypothetical protein
MALQHRFQAGLDETVGVSQWWLAAHVDRKDRRPRSIGPEHPWLRQKSGFFGTAHAAVARVLRGFGLALLGSPVLVLVHGALVGTNPVAAGWVVVGFVCAVLTFFAALNLFIVIALIRHLLHSQLALHLWDADAADRAAAEALLFPPGTEPTSRTGSVVSIGAPLDGDVVLRELVSRARNVRVLEASDFAIETDEGEFVVLRLEDAPLLLAAREPNARMALPEGTRTALAQAGITDAQDERGLHAHVVRLGDQVTVMGVEDTPIARADRFELGGELRAIKQSAAPREAYRGARSDSARLLSAVSGVPMLIVRETTP